MTPKYMTFFYLLAVLAQIFHSFVTFFPILARNFTRRWCDGGFGSSARQITKQLTKITAKKNKAKTKPNKAIFLEVDLRFKRKNEDFRQIRDILFMQNKAIFAI